MELKLQVKSSYGVNRIYPLCEKSKLLLKLVKAKTFTASDLAVLKNLGYTWTFIPLGLEDL